MTTIFILINKDKYPESVEKEAFDRENKIVKNSNDFNIDQGEDSILIFRSGFYDKELNGEIVQTTHELTYHTFNFKNKTITQKSKLNGNWITVSYPMNGFYKQSGLLATTYVFTINTLGVKEIWFSPDVPNLGYDYMDGSRIACYDVRQEK